MPLEQVPGYLLELAKLPVQLLTRGRCYDPDVVDRQACPKDDPAELLAGPHLRQGILLPTHEEEAAQIATVEFQKEGLDAGNLSLLLQSSEILHRFTEDAGRLFLAPDNGSSPPDEQRMIRHGFPPSAL
jgi:hypothetical protein